MTDDASRPGSPADAGSASERQPRPEVGLRRWTRDDGPLLARLLGDPVMTEHLGGPETPEQLAERLERYVTMDPDGGEPLVIVVLPSGEPVGFVGYWEREWHGETVWETGWSVVPAFQGRGIASAAMRQVIELAAARRRFGRLVAFPSVDNAASNAVCRRLGFTLLGDEDDEYPKGHWMRINAWGLDLPIPAAEAG